MAKGQTSPWVRMTHAILVLNGQPMTSDGYWVADKLAMGSALMCSAHGP